MHFLTLASSALLLGGSLAVPTPHSGHIRHEKRTHSAHLVRRHRPPPATKLPVRISITQRNLDFGHDRLMEISNPTSNKYGQHMSAKEVGDLFRPSSESIESVRHWLHFSGIDTDRHRVSLGQSWIKFDATVEELESLLLTKYFVYQHGRSREFYIGCDDYHIPETIHPHIDFISPTVSTLKVTNRATRQKRDTKSFSSASFPPHVKPVAINMSPNANDKNEIPCHTAVTPACLRQLYGIPMGNSSQAGNEIGIFEDGDYYDQTDLDLTFESIAPYIPEGTHPTLEGIDGGTAPLSINGVEQQAVLFQVDDLKEVEITQGFGNTFLDALDASYCTFEGGDDPTLDPQYPDDAPNPANESYLPEGTWDQPEMCGAYKPTNVISVSYGLGEDAFSYFYENRQCVEYMKLGLQGVTVVYSSGDSGVSNRGDCIRPSIIPNGTDVTKNPGAFSPSFPASCPYLTSVGATQINPDDQTETAVGVDDEEYYSGGGFSNYWPAPSYQEATLAKYFANTPPPYDNLTAYGTPYYNKSGRGYPDLAAVGLNIVLYAQSEPALIGGTSASAPIISSIITLINERRLDAGKSTVGFINPTLYANPDAFTDITTGGNPGCNTAGFSAVQGWDPVTGLGTPIFSKLLDVFMALP